MSARRIYTSGRNESRFGHGQYLDVMPTMRSVDNQTEILAAVRRARAEREVLVLAPSDMVAESSEASVAAASLWKRRWGKMSIRWALPGALPASRHPDQGRA